MAAGHARHLARGVEAGDRLEVLVENATTNVGFHAAEIHDIVRAAGGVRRTVVKEVRGVQVRDKLEISLRSRPCSQPPQLNGLEIELQTPAPKTSDSKKSATK